MPDFKRRRIRALFEDYLIQVLAALLMSGKHKIETIADREVLLELAVDLAHRALRATDV